MSKTEVINSAQFPVVMEDIVQQYIVGETTITALNSINLRVKKQEFVMIMGPSGSGKSTLLNVIAGLEKPYSGRVLIDGKNINRLSDRQLSQIRRTKIGIIFQFFNLHPVLTAVENVELPMLIAGIKRVNRQEKAMKLLEIVGLDKRADHYPHELSGGEKQRVGIARALANDPSILLADEPTGDMDSVTGREIMNLLVKLNKEFNKTIICVTHDEEMLEPGMRLLEMEDGRITSDKSL